MNLLYLIMKIKKFISIPVNQKKNMMGGFNMTEIYCVSCGEFVMGQETEAGEGICPKCKEQIEKIVNEG